MSININLKVVRFGEIVYQTTTPMRETEDALASRAQEPASYYVPRETAPSLLEVRYERTPVDYRVPNSTG